MEGTHVNTMNTIYDKPTSSITLNGENMKLFQQHPEPQTRMPTLTNTIQHRLESLAKTVGKKKKFKGYKLERKKLNSLCLWMI